jgi:hypothetical protein
MEAKILHQLCRPGIIETKSIDERAIRGQPEKARFFVSLLRLIGNGPHLYEAKTEGGQGACCRAILIKAGSQADRVRELEPETFQFVEPGTFITARKHISDWAPMQK